MRPRQFSLCELMWTVTAAAVFLGVMKTLSAEEDNGAIFLVCWVLSVVVLRLVLGWRVALFVSVAFGAVFFGLFAFWVSQSHHPSRFSPAEAMVFGFVIGVLVGAAIAGSGIVAGWLIHQLGQATMGIRFPSPHNR